MGTQPRECKRSDIEHVRKFVAYAKSVVNETRYYPPAHGYRYMVALALYRNALQLRRQYSFFSMPVSATKPLA